MARRQNASRGDAPQGAAGAIVNAPEAGFEPQHRQTYAKDQKHGLFPRRDHAREPADRGEGLRGRKASFLAAVGDVQNLVGDHPRILTNGELDLIGDRRIGLQESLGVLTALPKPLAVIGEPGS